MDPLLQSRRPTREEEIDNAADPVNCACSETCEAASGDWVLCDYFKTWKHSYCEALTESDLSALVDGPWTRSSLSGLEAGSSVVSSSGGSHE